MLFQENWQALKCNSYFIMHVYWPFPEDWLIKTSVEESLCKVAICWTGTTANIALCPSSQSTDSNCLLPFNWYAASASELVAANVGFSEWSCISWPGHNHWVSAWRNRCMKSKEFLSISISHACTICTLQFWNIVGWGGRPEKEYWKWNMKKPLYFMVSVTPSRLMHVSPLSFVQYVWVMWPMKQYLGNMCKWGGWHQRQSELISVDGKIK